MARIEMFISGVYRIQCVITKRQYIGQSSNAVLRFATHLLQLNGRRHINKALQQDWDQYGQNAFTFVVIKRIDCPRERCRVESSLINSKSLRGKLYNNTQLKQAKPTKKRRRAACKLSPFRERRYKCMPMQVVDSISHDDLPKLLTMNESAKRLGMSINNFKYHALKVSAPKAIGIGRQPKPFWYEADIAAWNPQR
jgi:hypothetical protein